MKTLFRNATLLTVNAQNDVISGGSLGMDNDRIVYVGPNLTDASEYDQIIDLSGKILMPGLINTHGHAAMTLLRGYCDDLPLNEWLGKIWPLEEQFGTVEVSWGVQLAMLEMLRSGTTCFLDMYDHMDAVAQAVSQSGMRASLTRGIIGLCSEKMQQQKLQEAKTFAQNWHNAANGRITTLMAPHSAYTCSPSYIEKIVAVAEDLALPIHTHMSETLHEVEENITKYGLRPPEHLARLGVFNRPTLVAHATHLTDEDIDLLAHYHVKVSHNPLSNLKLGAGVARVPDLLKKGITVSLGTDGAASNNNLNLFEEMKMVALLHKGTHLDPTVISATTALRMATIEGAKALFIDNNTGSLEVGKQADFIVIDTQAAHLQPLHHSVSHVVYAASGYDVCDVYVAGRALLLSGQFTTLDSDRVIFEANRCFERLVK